MWIKKIIYFWFYGCSCGKYHEGRGRRHDAEEVEVVDWNDDARNRRGKLNKHFLNYYYIYFQSKFFKLYLSCLWLCPYLSNFYHHFYQNGFKKCSNLWHDLNLDIVCVLHSTTWPIFQLKLIKLDFNLLYFPADYLYENFAMYTYIF